MSEREGKAGGIEMGKPRMASSLAAAVSLSRKTANQDAWRVVRNDLHPLTGIVVADGLGSHPHSEVGAAAAVDGACRELEELGEGESLDMTGLFRRAASRVRAEAEGRRQPGSSEERESLGTTLICAVETADEIVLGYVGNGAIFHLRGNFNTFPPSQLLPWTAMNYLNPHTKPVGGKNVLYRLLSAGAGEEIAVPTVLRLSKDEAWCGDIVLACTDGVYSYDQVGIGADAAGQIWISGERSMTLFYERLSQFFGSGQFTDGALSTCLGSFLQAMEQAGLVTDDCTVGVLVTGKALSYQVDRAVGVSLGAER